MARTKRETEAASASPVDAQRKERATKRKLVAEQREWMLEQKKRSKNTKDDEEISTLDEKEASDEDSGVEDVNDVQDFEKLTKKELEVLCKNRGLILKGSKKDLIEALNKSETDEKSKETLVPDEAVISENSEPEKEIVEMETPAEKEAEIVDLYKLSRKELEALCQDKGLSVKGNKKDLIKSLEKSDDAVEIVEDTSLEVVVENSSDVVENNDMEKNADVDDSKIENAAQEELIWEENAEKDPAETKATEATTEPAKDFTSMTKRELEALCVKNSLSSKGNKKDLIERLNEHEASGSTADASNNEATAEDNAEATASEDLNANDRDESEATLAPVNNETESNESLGNDEAASEEVNSTEQTTIEDSPLVEEDALKGPPLVEKDAPQASPLAEEDAPQASPLVEEDLPQASLLVEEEVPRTSPLAERDAPQTSLGVEEDAPQALSTLDEVAIEESPTMKIDTNEKIIPAEREETSFDTMAYKQLKALCKEHNLSVKGNKAELVERLQALQSQKVIVEEPVSNAEPEADAAINKIVEEEELKDSVDLIESDVQETVQNKMQQETEVEEVTTEISQPIEETFNETVAAETVMESATEDETVSLVNNFVENIEEIQIADENEGTTEESVEIPVEQVDYDSMTKKELEALCKQKGIATKGNKKDLIERLKTDFETQNAQTEEKPNEEEHPTDAEPALSMEKESSDLGISGVDAMDLDSLDLSEVVPTIPESDAELEESELKELEPTDAEYEVDFSVKTREELEELCRSLLNRMKETGLTVNATSASNQEEPVPLEDEGITIVSMEMESSSEDAETSTSRNFSSSLNPSTIAELVQKKEANELTQEDLFSMFLLTAQESLTNGQKIVDLEKRLEETEARIEKIEVVSGETASIADTVPEVCQEDVEAPLEEVVPENAASEEAALEEVASEEAAEQLEVPAAPSTSAETEAENVVEKEADNSSADEVVISSADIGVSPDEEIMESPAQNAEDPAETVSTPNEVVEEDITALIEKAEKTNTRSTRKRAKASGTSQSQRETRPKRTRVI